MKGSFDPFDHLAGRVVKSAKHVDSGARRRAYIDFVDGSTLSFEFDREVRLDGISPEVTHYSFTPVRQT